MQSVWVETVLVSSGVIAGNRWSHAPWRIRSRLSSSLRPLARTGSQGNWGDGTGLTWGDLTGGEGADLVGCTAAKFCCVKGCSVSMARNLGAPNKFGLKPIHAPSMIIGSGIISPGGAGIISPIPVICRGPDKYNPGICPIPIGVGNIGIWLPIGGVDIVGLTAIIHAGLSNACRVGGHLPRSCVACRFRGFILR